MTRRWRITIELGVPPLLAAILLVVTSPTPSYGIAEILIGFPALVATAYVFGILPCSVYAVLMEFWFEKGFNRRCGWLSTAILSSLIGGCAGFLIQLVVPGGLIELVPIGFIAGLTVGGCLGWYNR